MGRCELCGEAVASEDLLEHLRVLHPVEYGDGPQRWPDGAVVVEDETDYTVEDIAAAGES